MIDMVQASNAVAGSPSDHPGTPVSSDVERVARAICEAERMNPDDPLGGWRHWTDAARAAIAAMPDPVEQRRTIREDVMALRARKFSFGEIARKLDITRSAVAGICFRAKAGRS